MNSDLEHVWKQSIRNQKAYTTDKSEWTLDLGAKIERFHDGSIEIHNTITPGENYTPLTRWQRRYFVDNGWDAGRYNVCLEVYESRLQNAERKDFDIEGIKDKIDLFKIKLKESLDAK